MSAYGPLGPLEHMGTDSGAHGKPRETGTLFLSTKRLFQRTRWALRAYSPSFGRYAPILLASLGRYAPILAPTR